MRTRLPATPAAAPRRAAPPRPPRLLVLATALVGAVSATPFVLAVLALAWVAPAPDPAPIDGPRRCSSELSCERPAERCAVVPGDWLPRCHRNAEDIACASGERRVRAPLWFGERPWTAEGVFCAPPAGDGPG